MQKTLLAITFLGFITISLKAEAKNATVLTSIRIIKAGEPIDRETPPIPVIVNLTDQGSGIYVGEKNFSRSVGGKTLNYKIYLRSIENQYNNFSSVTLKINEDNRLLAAGNSSSPGVFENDFTLKRAHTLYLSSGWLGTEPKDSSTDIEVKFAIGD
jgi:hypothetical protein